MPPIGQLGWIAIAVVTILVLVWITHSAYSKGYLPDGVFKDTYESMIASAYRSYDKFIESPENLYTRTVGYENDAIVTMAVDKATKLEEMHHNNSNNLTTTASDAANNSFILAELNRFNIAPSADGAGQQNAMDIAEIMYRRTLSRIRNNPLVIAQTNDHAEAMLDRIEMFDLTMHPDAVDPLHPAIEEARDYIRLARVDIARNPKPKPKSKLTGRAAYYEPKQVRNDPQNVHDSQLTHALRVKYDTIVAHNKHDQTEIGTRNYKQPAIADILVELNRAKLEESTSERATQILRTMSAGGQVSSIGASEDQIVLEVWKRINSSDNADNREELKQSLWTALASGMEPNYQGEYTAVCTVGRCSRVLDSLTLMDADSKLAKPPQTSEILRNEILSKSYVILQDALRDSPVAAVYNGTTTETDENRQALDDFKHTVKNRIEDTIRQDYPEAKPETLNNLIKDAKAGI